MILKLTWAQKRMFWAFEKGIHSSVFCKFFSDVETVFWESETEPSRPFKFKVGDGKLYRKWFWSDLEIKNKCSKHLEREIFSFLQFLSEEVKPFSEKVKQNTKSCLNQFGHKNFLRKSFWSFLQWVLWAFEKGIFQFFANFWVTKLKPFSGKARHIAAKRFCIKSVLLGAF